MSPPKYSEFVAGVLRDGSRQSGIGRLREVIGWSFTYLEDGARREFTARLTPLGRGSTEADWARLGQVLAQLGAPLDPVPETVRSEPNAVHRWEWTT